MTQIELLQRAVNVLTEMGVSYMVVGSLASSAYSEPRYTNDIDIAVWLDREDIPVLCRAFPSPAFYLDEHTAAEAQRTGNMFNVIDTESGQKIDFMVSPRDMWSREQFWRKRKLRVVEGLETYVAAPEDIIISKMRYYRQVNSDKHLRDIASMMMVSGGEIDEACIVRWATHFEVLDVWEAVLKRLGR